MSWPSIDHSMLSPSGRVSERSRRAAIKQARALLFPAGITAKPQAPAFNEKQALLQQASRLEDLANRGMKPRGYAKEAARLRAEAEAIA